MTARKTWIVYTLARLAFFAVPLIILSLIGFQLWVAAIFATLIAFSLSVIFLRNIRDDASETIYDWRNRDRTEDDITEDALLDDSSPEAEAADADAADLGAEGNTGTDTNTHTDEHGTPRD